MTPILTTITPKIAAEWLAFNTGNRPLHTSHVADYCKRIRSGEFTLTHQGIAFSGNPASPKRLLDGQTRLTAIVQTGIPIQQWVFWGAEDETFSAIDGGKSRSFRDHHGWDKDLVSIVGVFYQITSRSTQRMSKAEADRIRSVIEPHLSNLTNTKRAKLSKAAVACGFVRSMIQNPDRAMDIAAQYEALVLNKTEHMEPSVGRLCFRLVQSSFGGAKANVIMYFLSKHVSTPSNFKITKLYQPGQIHIDAEIDDLRNLFGICNK
jgi:hypothetical protein